MYKKLANLQLVQSSLCWIAAAYIRIVFTTSRWKTHNCAGSLAIWNSKAPFILAFWHGRLLMMPNIWTKDRPIDLLISNHRDGELLAKTMDNFGFQAIRGSSSRGGRGAFREILRALKSGRCIGLTPDGPRGPHMRASNGIITLARLSGAPIIPSVYSTSHRKVLQSWDRFILPFPFSRGIFIWGEPIYIPRNADVETIEEARTALELSLNKITEAADQYCNVEVVRPSETSLNNCNGDPNYGTKL